MSGADKTTNEVNKGTRIVNFVIDIIIITVISEIIKGFVNYRMASLVYYLVYFMYYILFEFIKGQTIGKMITKTKVVNMLNVKPSFGRIFYRTFLRLNPFDTASYLFGHEQGGHDLLSKTRLVNKKTGAKR